MENLKKTMAALLCAAVAGGCAASPIDPSSHSNTNPGKASSQASSVVDSSQGQTDPISATADELNKLYSFSWNLFARSRTENENAVFSPFSAWMALGMAANGADGKTLKQMEEVLGLSKDQINTLAKAALNAAAGDDAHTLRLANSIWIRKEAANSILESYQNLLTADYQAQSYEVDFDEATEQQVNDWVKAHTDGLIQQMPIDTSPMTMMVLLNALSFDSAWQEEYKDDQIAPATFHNQNGSESRVQMMSSDENQYLHSQGLHGCMKPYQEYHYGLSILVPQEDRPLDEVLKEVDGTKLFQDLKNPTFTTVHAQFPEFTLASEQSLKKPLETMGMTLPFQSEADFSKISTGQKLSVSEIVQKAKIEVSRTGTRAAAATDVAIAGMALAEEEYTITCDRPFLYIISDLETGTPVFIGTVEDLSGTTSQS